MKAGESQNDFFGFQHARLLSEYNNALNPQQSV